MCPFLWRVVDRISVLFFSRAGSEGWPRHGRTFSIYLKSSVILIDSSAGSPVHVLMSTQAVRGLPRLRAPGIVPTITLRQCQSYDRLTDV